MSLSGVTPKLLQLRRGREKFGRVSVGKELHSWPR